MGSEIIVDPKSPKYLTEYDFQNFLIKVRHGKLYLVSIISNSGITLSHNTDEKFLLESLQESQSNYYLVKRGNKYCLSEYYVKLDETDFE
ncbi:MAG: hypothetical protein J0G96_08365 [Flavobacteriia bacterium]|nr:hypothetical protein [Flavobacteriia bacterium]